MCLSYNLNPFAPETHVTASADLCPFYACDIISVNGQGQLCSLTWGEWRDLSNHSTISTIQPRTPEKNAKNHVTLTRKFPWKSCSTTYLPFPSSNPKILKAFLKTFWQKKNQNETYQIPSKGEKNWGKKNEKRGEERKRKVKFKTAVLQRHAAVSTFCCLCMPELHKLKLCIWIRRSRSACTICKWLCGKFKLSTEQQWPENQSTSFKTLFSAKSPGANGLRSVHITMTVSRGCSLSQEDIIKITPDQSQ